MEKASSAVIFCGQNATGHRTRNPLTRSGRSTTGLCSYRKQKTLWRMKSPWTTLLVSKIKMTFKRKFYDRDKTLQMSRSKKAIEQH